MLGTHARIKEGLGASLEPRILPWELSVSKTESGTENTDILPYSLLPRSHWAHTSSLRPISSAGTGLDSSNAGVVMEYKV